MLVLCHYFGISTLNKNNIDGSQYSKRKYAFGLFLLLLVVILWVLSSEMTKYIYEEKGLDRPFLITYVRSSLLFVYLLVLCFTPPTKDPCRPTDYTQLLEPTAETDEESYISESGNSLGDSTFVPVRAGETTDSDDAAPRAVRFNKVAEVRVMSAAMAGEALLARLSWQASVRATEYAQRRAAAAATRRHLRLAVMFSVPWFLSNYLYRLSLEGSVAAACTIFTSAYISFTLVVTAMFPLTPSERFSFSKFVACLLTFVGVVLLSWSLTYTLKAMWSSLGSAALYGMLLLMIREESKNGEGINSPLLVGLVGCACGCLAWVLGGILGAAGVEPAELPPPKLWSWVLLDAAIGPLLMESLWLWGRSLTSPQAATAMLGLTMPLSACVVFYRQGVAGASLLCGVSSLLTAAGWVCAAFDVPRTRPQIDCLPMHRAQDGFSALRSIPELDEQSEALMCSDEPT